MSSQEGQDIDRLLDDFHVRVGEDVAQDVVGFKPFEDKLGIQGLLLFFLLLLALLSLPFALRRECGSCHCLASLIPYIRDTQCPIEDINFGIKKSTK